MGSSGRDVGQRARRRLSPGPAKPRVAVDRADRRRDGGVLHHHRAAVPGLPGADRSPRPARRRRSGVDGRPDRAPRRVPRHGSRLDGRQAPRDEIVELAMAFRIPVAPIATPQTMHDHRPLRASAACSSNRRGRCRRAAGALSQRRDTDPAPRRRRRRWAPTTAGWPGTRAAKQPAPQTETSDPLPLTGIRVVDFTAFWAGPGRDPGARPRSAPTSSRSKGVRRPDGMRFAGGRPPSWDQWWEWGPVFLCSNTNKRGISLELSTPQGRQAALELIAAQRSRHRELLAAGDGQLRSRMGRGARRQPAGDDGPDARVRPRRPVARPRRLRADHGTGQRHGLDDRTCRRPAADSARRVRSARRACTRRSRPSPRWRSATGTGTGMHVESTMVEAALNVAAEAVLEYSRNGVELRRNGNRGPGRQPPGRLPVPGDDEWVALAVLDDDAWPALATLIGRRELAADPALRDEAGRRRACRRDRQAHRRTGRRSAASTTRSERCAHSGIGAARGHGRRGATRRRTPCRTGRSGRWSTIRSSVIPVHRHAVHVRRATRGAGSPTPRAAVRPAHRRGADRMLLGRHREQDACQPRLR